MVTKTTFETLTGECEQNLIDLSLFILEEATIFFVQSEMQVKSQNGCKPLVVLNCD